MAEISLHFEMAPDADLQQAAAEIHQRLAGLSMVEEADARPESSRMTGAEIVAAIAATVLVVRAGRELVDEAAEFCGALKRLIGEIAGVKNVLLEVGAKRVPLDELTEEQAQELLRS